MQNKYFTHIYCINLDRRPDRWELAQIKCKAAGLMEVERFSATDGKLLDLDFDDLYKAEIATFMSHLSVFKDAQKNNYQNILILEDDAEFVTNFELILVNILKKIPLDWDMIYLGGNDKKESTEINQQLVKLSCTVALHAYAVSSKCIAYLISFLETELAQILKSKIRFKPNVAVDEAIAKLHTTLNVYAPKPYIAYQIAGFSDVQQAKTHYSELIYDKVKYDKEDYNSLHKFKHKFQIKRKNSWVNQLWFKIMGLSNCTQIQKINLIIFSKDRAFQLDALLQSIAEFATIFDKINVLYKSTNISFDQGYELLKIKYSNINWVKERDFKSDLMNFCFDLKANYTCFLVDDNLFYQPLPLAKPLILSLINKQTACFSLRMGLNCTYSHPSDKYFKINKYEKPNIDTVKWLWRDENVDFNYPLSLDGHIFHTQEIYNIVNITDFLTPNTLEDRIQKHNKKLKPYMLSFEHSILLGLPVNKVNTDYENRYGTSHYYSEIELNEKYLGGEVLAIHKMDFKDVNGCHYETKFIFATDSNNLE